MYEEEVLELSDNELETLCACGCGCGGTNPRQEQVWEMQNKALLEDNR